MLYVSLFATVIINLSIYKNVESVSGTVSYAKRDGHKIVNTLTSFTKSNNAIIPSKTESTIYLLSPLDKRVNLYKRHNNKKYPKRMIQKIIKKSKKNRNKLFMNQITSTPTEPPPPFELKEESTSTTQAVIRKKPKKWNAKFARNPLPFHKLGSMMNNHHKSKREIDRDIYILQDLDEIEFLSNENGPNAVRAHVKRYW